MLLLWDRKNKCFNHIYEFPLLFSNHVLQISDGIGTMGGVRLELFGYLVLAWVLVYLVIWKGLQNSGKVKLFIVSPLVRIILITYSK